MSCGRNCVRFLISWVFTTVSEMMKVSEAVPLRWSADLLEKPCVF